MEGRGLISPSPALSIINFNLYPIYKYTIFKASKRLALDREPSLPPSLVFGLLIEDAVHHRDEQHPRRIRRGATGPPVDGVRRPATEHVANVCFLNYLVVKLL